jgi:hypothetical protein
MFTGHVGECSGLPARVKPGVLPGAVKIQLERLDVERSTAHPSLGGFDEFVGARLLAGGALLDCVGRPSPRFFLQQQQNV